MKIVYSALATEDLIDIINYTNAQHGEAQAVRYETFLTNGINSLAVFPEQGTTVPNEPTLRRILLKWPRSRNAHIAIYELDEAEQRITIHAIYGSSQNIEQKLKERMRDDDDDQ